MLQEANKKPSLAELRAAENVLVKLAEGGNEKFGAAVEKVRTQIAEQLESSLKELHGAEMTLSVLADSGDQTFVDAVTEVRQHIESTRLALRSLKPHAEDTMQVGPPETTGAYDSPEQSPGSPLAAENTHSITAD